MSTPLAVTLRKRAEQKLRKKTAATSPADADPQRLLQELQIYKIELELQNEELKQAKAEVDAGLEKFTDLYDFAPVGYFSLSEEGQILEANLTGATLLGVERSRLMRRRFQVFVAPASRRAFNEFLTKVFAGCTNQVCETSLLHADRETVWVDVQAKSAAPADGDAPWCRVAVIDITERKEAEAVQHRSDILAATNHALETEILQRVAAEVALKHSEHQALELLAQSRVLQKKLKRVSHQILMAEETLRMEISRELHDKISQLLLGINVHLGIFTKAAVANPDGIKKTIAPLRRLVMRSVRTIHDLSAELRPALLDDLGLIPALRSYIDSLPKSKDRTIKFTACESAEKLDKGKRTVLYRVALEALSNATKHSKASVVTVSLTDSDDGVCLAIKDDGEGFDVAMLSSARWRYRLGVVGMRERVEMVGGEFDIESEIGTGTTVRAMMMFGKGER